MRGDCMISYNLLLVLNKEKNAVLMCDRIKDPYKGLYNLLGGKIEENEDILESAYRELEEESGIKKTDITLKHFIDFTWHTFDMDMKVFIGKLNKDVDLIEEVHPLHWIDIESDFFDMNNFAGEGNIGHMIQIYKLNEKIVD